MTIKSDDVPGRSKAYEAIIKGEPIKKMNIPESFNVLVRELKGLCLDVELLDSEGKVIREPLASTDDMPAVTAPAEDVGEKIAW